ncbi:tetratricopeptide repeat protein [uncultured Croceitalea sp.]|uniref:tetratricopeptide repeat protein n=1 Tax=uncultured Croceitalea sp. TaxID=1798908 RepID=UPI003305A731
MSSETNKSWFQNLWDRKVPQYLGTYFAVGFGLLQFVEFLTIRYNLSEYLVDKYLLVWFTLVPAIITLIYFNDQLNPKTKSGVVKWPKFLVIGNVIVAFLLGGLLFNGDNTKQVEIVNLTNEEGKEVKALVPALKKVKTVASFQFENLTNDADQDWWGVAFSDLLESSLDQRPEFYTFSQYSLHRFYDGLGLTSFTVPNVGMQREIAQKSRSDYFSRISYNIEGKQFVFKGNLYSSKTGKSVFSISAKNSSPFLAIDAIKQQIYDNIPNPLKTEENQVSLPSSSLITSNVEALKYLTQSNISFLKNPRGLDEVVALGEKAIELDDTCAICYYTLAQPVFGMGKRDEAIVLVKKAIKYGASLPERTQFYPKEILYSITNNTDAYYKLQEMRRKMYPYEFKPYQQLLPLYKTNYGIDSAKVLIKEAIDNGNIERGMLTLYNLQVESEDYIEAEKTLDKFSLEFPDREQDRMKYANIYEKQGRIEKAKEILEEEETLDPLNTVVQTRLAYLDFKNLDIDGAYKRVEMGIAQSTSLTDSLNYLLIKTHFLRMCGQIDEALKVYADYENYGLKTMPLSAMLGRTLMGKGDMYYSINQPQKTNELYREMDKYSPESTIAFKCNIQANSIFREYGLTIKDEDFMPCGKFYENYGDGFKEYFSLVNFYRLGDYEKCLSILQEDKGRIRELLADARYFLADIYYKNGDAEKAKDILEKAIEQKTDEPFYYYRMAVILENENKKKARAYLDIAMQYWAEADKDFILVKKANELSNRLLIYDKDES